MSTISFLGLESLSFNRCEVNPRTRFYGTFATVRMTIDSKSSERTKVEEISVRIPSTPLPVPRRESLFTSPQFDRLQPSEDGLSRERKHEFGSFVAREAMLDEEYWTAAWIRAESHWENRVKDRYVDNHKRQFAEQEFNELKKRSIWQQGQKGTCIVAVRKAVPNVQRTILKSVVGTLDLSVRYLLPGETFPGERVNAPPFCSVKRTPQNRYCYIANVCVVIAVRRQGIASNMLHFAVESAISDGVGQIYMHVHKYNEGALELYRKAGFEIVEQASSHLLEEKMFLLRFKM